MPVPSSISALSQTAGSNYPAGSESPTTTDDYLRAHAAFIAQLRDGKGQSQEVTVASATTCDIGAANSQFILITGSTAISSFGTNYNGPRFIRFSGTLTLTHSASLVLPGGQDITTTAGDTCVAVPLGNPASGWQISGFTISDFVDTNPDFTLDITDNTTQVLQAADFTVTNNCTVGSDVTGVTLTKTGASSEASIPTISLPDGNDWILYLKVKLSSGVSGAAVNFILGPSGSPSMTLSVGYDHVAGAASAGAVSVDWQGSTKVMFTGQDYVTDFLHIVVHYDSDFEGLMVYTKGSDGTYTLGGGVAGAFVYTDEFRATFAGTSANGLVATLGSARYFCRPNFISMGDSISKGATLFDPDPATASKNYASCWQSYVQITELENTLIVNKGIGGDDSNQINARIATQVVAHQPRFCILHLSTNDYGSGYTYAQRTTWTQDSIDQMHEAGIKVILLSAVYPNSNAANYPDNSNYYRGYMTDSNGFRRLSKYTDYIDFMENGLGDSNDDISASLAQADGVHPTPAGYAIIGGLVEEYFTGQTTPKARHNLLIPGSLYVNGLIYGNLAEPASPTGWSTILYTNAGTPKWTINLSSGNTENNGLLSLEDGTSSDEVLIHFSRQHIIPGGFQTYGTGGSFNGIARLVSITTITAGEDYRARYVVRKLSDGTAPTGAELNAMQFYVKY